jgi:3'(2'), 5'-bisphosphate nucleotidase
MSEWDDCAAEIILSEAGGTLSNVFGDPMLYNQENVSRTKGVLANNGSLHKELLQKIDPIAKEEYPATL